MAQNNTEYIDSVIWKNDRLVLLEQTKLPLETCFEELTGVAQVWEAIYKLKVRGAPAIGVAAGYGLYLAVMNSSAVNYDQFLEELSKNADYLASSRPTAVNLFWALDRMKRCAQTAPEKSIPAVKASLLKEAHAIKAENSAICEYIGIHGLPFIKDGMGILTHCNAGPIATASRYGTALAPMIMAHEQGLKIKVYADETRPLNQGSRLTAWELFTAGIDVTLICDNMAAMVMAEGKIQAVFVGCDRVARNGDFANKIGTYGVAILAKEHGIPFYVAAPSSTIDMAMSSGKEIVIEERKAEEITCGFGQRTAPEKIPVYNPAFDVTPAKYVTAIITEKGAVTAPFATGITQLFKA